MKILCTGGAGFIGSHLCERLTLLGHEVVSLDNYFTGSKDNHVPGVRYIEDSTENILSLDEWFDVIYHLGEYSRVEQSFGDFDLVWNYNKLGTYEVLKYAKKVNAKLIYAGSSTKFANVDVVSPYQWSKSSNTTFVKNYCEWNNLEYVITYFYNAYGKREISHGKYATLIAKFREHMKNGEALTVVSPGVQSRNFTHVEDIVDALILVGAYGYGDEYGIGNPTEYTVLEVAQMFGGNIEMLPERKGNRLSAPVIDTKTRQLSWKPTRSLEDWIKQLKQNNWILK
jgi:UDP-glucose 4-epimerase